MVTDCEAKGVPPRCINTQRLELRIPHAADAPALYEGVMSSVEVLKPWLAWAQDYEERGLAAAEEAVQFFNDEFEERKGFNFLCFAGNTLVGGVGLMRPDERERSLEVGYWCVKRHQGRGYITEAAQAVVEYAFAYLPIEKLVILCDAKNVKSARVAERLKFRFVAEGFDLKPGEDCLYRKYERTKNDDKNRQE